MGISFKPKPKTVDSAVAAVATSTIMLLLDVVMLIITVKKINKESN